MLSINAYKGFEIGSRFPGTRIRGSVHNDPLVCKEAVVCTTTNNSGGVQGGNSIGVDIVFLAVFNPVFTSMQSQDAVDVDGNPVVVEGKVRHDPCVVPHAVSIVEAMALIILVDHWLMSRGLGG